VSVDLRYRPDMPADLKTPIGCVGAGFIMADCHLVAYRNAGFNPVAIYDPSSAARGKAAERHKISKAYDSLEGLLADEGIRVLDIAVPPDITLEVVSQAVRHAGHIRGILAQKPLGVDLAQARRIVGLCREAGITLAVNQNMRFDQSVRACRDLLSRGVLGEPVLATIEMRAIPHWMPWHERQGWCTLRIMSIHHLDTFRYWFGNPDRIFASVRPDPRTRFAHTDGIVLYVLEYDRGGLRASAWDDVWTGPAREGAAGDIYIRWRVEGTRGLAHHGHFSDCNGKVHGDLPPGQGVIDFIPWLRELKALEMPGVLSIELEFCPKPEMIVAWVSEAYRETARMMAEVGLRSL